MSYFQLTRSNGRDDGDGDVHVLPAVEGVPAGNVVEGVGEEVGDYPGDTEHSLPDLMLDQPHSETGWQMVPMTYRSDERLLLGSDYEISTVLTGKSGQTYTIAP